MVPVRPRRPLSVLGPRFSSCPRLRLPVTISAGLVSHGCSQRWRYAMSAERILVIQLRQLGDTLMSTPVLRELHRLHPQAEIDWLCQGFNACILRHNPHVTQIETLPRGASVGTFVGLAARLRRRRYNLVVDIQSLPKTAALTWFSGARERISFRRRWRHALYTKPYVPSPGFEYSAVARLRLLQDPRVRLDDVSLEFYVGEQDRQQGAGLLSPLVPSAGGRDLRGARRPYPTLAERALCGDRRSLGRSRVSALLGFWARRATGRTGNRRPDAICGSGGLRTAAASRPQRDPGRLLADGDL